MTTKVYLAGPMTGIKDLNFPAFFEGEKYLRSQGFETIFNPAQNDLDTWGDMKGVRENANYRECLKADLSWICDNADMIALLPGWEKSKGVKAELALSEALGLKVMYL